MTTMLKSWITLAVVASFWEISLCVTGDGTTPGFEKILEGRCLDYVANRFKDVLPRPTMPCSVITKRFLKAFVNKDPCQVSQDAYCSFISSTKQDLPDSKSLFWSGNYKFARRFAAEGHRFVNMDMTLMGYLADRLTWCGSKLEGLNFTQCPSWGCCVRNPVRSFWGAASTRFAKIASGVVTLLLNGSNPNKAAYRRENSFFATVELPNLNPKQVKVLKVFVTHDLDATFRDACNTGSLLLLEEDVKKHNLTFECHDNPDSILHILCSDNPDHDQCRFANQQG